MRFQLLFNILLIQFSFAACQQETAPEQSQQATATVKEVVEQADTIPYPIVENFDDLAPLFEMDNDTTYVINFWATWCAPCVAELPYFEQLAAEKANQPVKFTMISLDFKKQVRTKLLKFVQDRPLELPVIALTDTKTNEWIDRVDSAWSGAIPITIIYKGKNRRFFEGEFDDYEQLLNAVDEVSSL